MAPSHLRHNLEPATERYEGWEKSPGPRFFEKGMTCLEIALMGLQITG
jgi:hypothetical protein